MRALETLRTTPIRPDAQQDKGARPFNPEAQSFAMGEAATQESNMITFKHDLHTVADTLAMIVQDFTNGDMSDGEFLAALDETYFYANQYATPEQLNSKARFVVHQCEKNERDARDYMEDEHERAEAAAIAEGRPFSRTYPY